METFISIWGGVKQILDILGYPATVLVLVAAAVKAVRWSRGVVPVAMRVGNGLSSRKIAVFAKGEGYGTIRSVILRSSLFSEGNIEQVQDKINIESHTRCDFFVVYYPDWKDDFSLILSKKQEQTPLLVYCPRGHRIPDEVMDQIDGLRNTAVANFRGRLLNDIFTAMITTNYEK